VPVILEIDGASCSPPGHRATASTSTPTPRRAIPRFHREIGIDTEAGGALARRRRVLRARRVAAGDYQIRVLVRDGDRRIGAAVVRLLATT
jgi:hypothetical protein